jgi:hypothetical protein
MFRKILKWLDKVCCQYIGLGKKTLRLEKVFMAKDKLFIINREANKRHRYTDKWDDFTASHAKDLSSEDKVQLGIACGKAIAPDLVVVFDGAKLESSSEKEPSVPSGPEVSTVNSQNYSFKFLGLGILFYTMILIFSNWFDLKLIHIGNINTDAGTLIFPLTFLLSNIITEVYGYKNMRQIIWWGFLFSLFLILYGLIIWADCCSFT